MQLTAVFRDFSLYFLSMSQYVMKTNKYGGLEGTVAPAGTSSHKALTVLGDEWESTLVAMFVTSSYGHILPKELANNGLLPPTKNTCICFWGGEFCISAQHSKSTRMCLQKEGFGLCCFCEEHTRFVPLCKLLFRMWIRPDQESKWYISKILEHRIFAFLNLIAVGSFSLTATLNVAY